MGTHRLVVAVTGVNLVLVVALLVLGHRAFAASRPEVIRAKAIELVDESGRIRAQINVEQNGEAVLRLRDSRGEIRVKLGAGEEGSGLLLLDGSTEPGIHMLAESGGTSVTLASKGGQRRVITP